MCEMVEGITVTPKNGPYCKKNYIADKCWLNICPLSKSCIHLIAYYCENIFNGVKFQNLNEHLKFYLGKWKADLSAI